MGGMRSYLGLEREVTEWVGLEKRGRVDDFGILA